MKIYLLPCFYRASFPCFRHALISCFDQEKQHENFDSHFDYQRCSQIDYQPRSHFDYQEGIRSGLPAYTLVLKHRFPVGFLPGENLAFAHIYAYEPTQRLHICHIIRQASETAFQRLRL